jgi:transposase
MKVEIIAIDLAKRVFQVHGGSLAGRLLVKRRLTRDKLTAFLAQIPKCIVAMEACSTSHYWARFCLSMGHEVRLVPAQHVRPYVKSQKNDVADAAAIFEAACRATMRFVPVKSEEQQSIQALHRVRERLKRDRTAVVNELRGLLAEFGVVFPVTIHKLRHALDAYLNETAARELPILMIDLCRGLRADLAILDKRIVEIEVTMKTLNQQSDACRRLMQVPGIGQLNASAFVAAIGRGQQFARGRDLAAWLGLVPQQTSSGTRTRLGRITKRGDSYLRHILIHGARAHVVRVAARAGTPRNRMEQWIVRLLARKHLNTVVVAVANKLARIIWALLHHQTTFSPIPSAEPARA